jgi:hypothetical protein
MKLSTPQETVIEMMNEGWKLLKTGIQHPECSFTTSVNLVTIKALERKGLILWTGDCYHLTPSKDATERTDNK